MFNKDVYACLNAFKRIWVIGAVNGDYGALKRIHQQLSHAIFPGDFLIYLGNYYGGGQEVVPCVNEILRFRRYFLSKTQALPDHIVFLRGSHEEMLSKILQLHFAPDPQNVLNWVLRNGLSHTLSSYGLCVDEVNDIVRQGPQSIFRWVQKLKHAVVSCDGHRQLLNHLHHMAYCFDRSMLFVHAGLDVHLSLRDQEDRFWWYHYGFYDINHSCYDFSRVVRGSSGLKDGFIENDYVISLDGGAGQGGQLLCALMETHGQVSDVLTS